MSNLEAPFLPEEVEKIIKSMPLDKAPGPDGFTGRFYATCWQIIKVDFMRALDQFFGGDMRGLAAINRAVVTLLPKKEGAVDLKDFRLGPSRYSTRSWRQDLRTSFRSWWVTIKVPSCGAVLYMTTSCLFSVHQGDSTLSETQRSYSNLIYPRLLIR